MAKTYGKLTIEPPAGFRDESTITFSRPSGRGQSYPLNVNLVCEANDRVSDPLPHLRLKLKQLGPQLRGFSQATLEPIKIAGNAGARAQFSFFVELKLVQLLLMWVDSGHLLTATLSTIDNGVDEGWQVLTQFARSVRLDVAGPRAVAVLA